MAATDASKRILGARLTAILPEVSIMAGALALIQRAGSVSTAHCLSCGAVPWALPSTGSTEVPTYAGALPVGQAGAMAIARLERAASVARASDLAAHTSIANLAVADSFVGRARAML